MSEYGKEYGKALLEIDSLASALAQVLLCICCFAIFPVVRMQATLARDEEMVAYVRLSHSLSASALAQKHRFFVLPASLIRLPRRKRRKIRRCQFLFCADSSLPLALPVSNRNLATLSGFRTDADHRAVGRVLVGCES